MCQRVQRSREGVEQWSELGEVCVGCCRGPRWQQVSTLALSLGSTLGDQGMHMSRPPHHSMLSLAR